MVYLDSLLDWELDWSKTLAESRSTGLPLAEREEIVKRCIIQIVSTENPNCYWPDGWTTFYSIMRNILQDRVPEGISRNGKIVASIRKRNPELYAAIEPWIAGWNQDD